MLEEILDNLKKDFKKIGKVKLLLAVSGGVDSMLLWYLLHKLEFDYAVSHVNFQLRGEASEADEALIQELARKRQTELFVKHAETKTLSKKWSLSTQETARKIRYDFFDEIMKEQGFTHLLTAHHLDDSIETFFINLNRGTGLKGLSGIGEHPTILRPLLKLTKEEIRALAEQAEIDFREDASNAETTYLRNFFRLQILPQWKERNPQFKQTMRENMSRLEEAQSALKKVIDKDLEKLWPDFEKGLIPYQKIDQLQFPKLSLGELLSPLGFNFDQIENVLSIYRSARPGKIFESESHLMNLDREQVFVVARHQAKPTEQIQLHQSNFFQETPCYIALSEEENQALKLKVDGRYFLDFEELEWPLVLRKWKNGDRIKPLGMNGSKMVSDILIDAKVPQIKKEEVWLLESGENICAILGFGISELFKVKPKTKKVLAIKWKR
ncbi:MAG: tRNA lysidine(34) synthetase TilS [Vicingaceae bacterium]